VNGLLVIDKPGGMTSHDVVGKLRRITGERSIGHLGTLDPMATGVLPLLFGKFTRLAQYFSSAEKSYSGTIRFGFATDTYDILGKIIYSNFVSIKKKELEKIIKDNLKYFTGKFMQKYPLYSSKTVRGKQLFKYARSSEEVEVPGREVFVDSLKFNKIKTINKKRLLQNIEKRINKVKGDFRQKEILKTWRKNLFYNKKIEKFYIASFKIKCGSGTYVRGIANSLGNKIGLPTLAFSIKRTKIGRFEIKDVNN